MDATCAIQASIHVFSLVRKYVSRILGTYHTDHRGVCYLYNFFQEFFSFAYVPILQLLTDLPYQIMTFSFFYQFDTFKAISNCYLIRIIFSSYSR